MTEAMERAKRELLAAQAKVDALSRVPAKDTFGSGTTLKFKRVGLSQIYVALKHGEFWWVSGRERGINWDTLVQWYLTQPLDCFLVADHWADASVEPPEPEPPTLKLGQRKAGWTLRDNETGISWVRHGNTWERLD